MRRSEHAEVLVVGAGPVGMFASLLLAREGIRVLVIDEASGPAERAYACALHPRTLQLLELAGLDEQVMECGQRVDTMAFYEGASRRAALRLCHPPSEFPLVALPQSELEAILENSLSSEGRTPVLWRHRLSALRPAAEGMSATIETLAGTARGYAVPHWETIVKDTTECHARYVIGADGHNSLVRRLLGIDFQERGPHELFVVYEFDTDAVPDEVRVVLNQRDMNVLWPLAENRCRWSFQWTKTDEPGAFPEKERSHLWCEAGEMAQFTRQHLQEMIRTRAPWFTSEIEHMDWAGDIEFRPRLAEHFGEGHAWLAGDAAHQTGPIGVQSMNAGFREAQSLAEALTAILRAGASPRLLEEYDRRFHAEWEHMLGRTGRLVAGPNPLLAPQPGFLSCLPASGNDLSPLLLELGWSVQERSTSAE